MSKVAKSSAASIGSLVSEYFQGLTGEMVQTAHRCLDLLTSRTGRLPVVLGDERVMDVLVRVLYGKKLLGDHDCKDIADHYKFDH